MYRDHETFIMIKDNLSIDKQIQIKSEIEKYRDMYDMQTDEDGIGYYLESDQCGHGLAPGFKFYNKLRKYKEYFSLFEYNSYFEQEINYHAGEVNLDFDHRNVYVVSDIHNDATGFKELLDKISFSLDDLLIINGDIFDLNDEPVELYFEIQKHSNIQVVQGDHDVWLAREILEKYDGRKVGQYIRYNSLPLLEKRLGSTDLVVLAKWLKEQPFYINLNLNRKKYRIAHAQMYETPERIWDKSKLYMGDEHYEYFIKGMEESEDFISIVGHRPTENKRIWVSPSGRTIRTDCGNGCKSNNSVGTLGAIRLNDMEEFYAWDSATKLYKKLLSKGGRNERIRQN